MKEHKRVLYYTLLTSGKLYEHLAEIDSSARDMAEYLIKKMAKKQGVTEELKATDMMRWVGMMNNTTIFLKRLIIYRRCCIMRMVMRNEKIHFHA